MHIQRLRKLSFITAGAFALGATSLLSGCGGTADDASAEAVASSSATPLVWDPSSTTLFTANGGVVPVCFRQLTGYGEYPEAIRAIGVALRRTWGRVANIEFSGFGDCPNAGNDRNVVISLEYGTDDHQGVDGQTAAHLGTAELRSPSDPTPSVRIWISRNHVYSDDRLAYVAVHEFGHVLGFGHENDSTSNWTSPNNYNYCQNGSYHPELRQIGAYDQQSVMNYCGPLLGRLSPGDISGVISMYGAHAAVAPRLSGMVWANPSASTAGIWLMNGLYVSSFGTAFPVPNGSSIAGTGDFDGDGRSDLLVRNGSTFFTYLLDAGASGVRRVRQLDAQVGSEWGVAGVGDFDDDGLADIVFRGPGGALGIWMLNGTTSVREFATPWAPVPLEWKIVGVGDFDGDHKSDLLWHNSSTGDVGVWVMNGGANVKRMDTVGNAGASSPWLVVGTGDFDGNGTADILWRRWDDGTLGMWTTGYSDHSFVTSFATIERVSSDLDVRAIGDFDGNGTSDIAWSDFRSTDVSVWLMNGTTTKARATVAWNVGQAWTLSGATVAPRGF